MKMIRVGSGRPERRSNAHLGPADQLLQRLLLFAVPMLLLPSQNLPNLWRMRDSSLLAVLDLAV